MLRGSCLCLPWRGAMSLEACCLFVLKVVHIPQQNPRVPKPHERNAIPDATHRYTIRVVKRKHHSTCRALVNLQDCCEPYELYDLIGSLHWNYPPARLPVTTRIIAFLVQNPYRILYLPLVLGGRSKVYAI